MKRFNRGEIWIIDLNPTIGREQAKKRPCLIISSNYLNNSKAQLVFAIPLTSKEKKISFHIPIKPPEGGIITQSYVMCEQLRSLSTDRIDNRLGMVENDTLIKVEDMLKTIFDF